MEVFIATAMTALISSVVGAFVATVVSQLKQAGSNSNEEKAKAKKEADDLKLMVTQNTLMTCRLVIYSDKFSVDEKLDAYVIYRDRGGNHQTKTYMDNLVGSDVDEYIEKHGV